MSTKKDYPTMIEDFGNIKVVVEREIIERLDHKDLNEFFEPTPPTAETIALWIFWQLETAYGRNIMQIRLTEGPNSWTTVVRGPKTNALIYKYFKDPNR
jgi:6-pyruvoyl-tetrahydropterin synthase